MRRDEALDVARYMLTRYPASEQGKRITQYLESLPEMFDYEPMMHEIVEKFTNYQMIRSANEFLTQFQLRMRKLKKNKDWMLI